MAELRIQPKKSAPSPWLLVALALLVLAAAAYFFLRPDPADEPAPAKTEMAPTPAPASTVPVDSANTRPTPSPAADTMATAPFGSTRAKLLALSPTLTQLADRADLRDDAAVREQRDNFTSATARLADGDPQAALRPGLVAVASLLTAVQQKAYPNLEDDTNNLQQQASQLSGRDATPTDQAQNRAYFDQVNRLLGTMSTPAGDVR